MARRWTTSFLMGILLVASGARGQILGGDDKFEIVNQLQWGMTASEVREVCATRTQVLTATDSTLTFKIAPFGFEARAKIQFERARQRMIGIDIAFIESTSRIRDTLMNHFVNTVGKKPLLTTKEKSFVIFTIKTEIASWVNGREGIHIFAMMRGNEVLGVTLLLSPFVKEKKPT
jgi:hypothetical protein